MKYTCGSYIDACHRSDSNTEPVKCCTKQWASPAPPLPTPAAGAEIPTSSSHWD